MGARTTGGCTPRATAGPGPGPALQLLGYGVGLATQAVDRGGRRAAAGSSCRCCKDPATQTPVGPTTRWSRLSSHPGRVTSCSIRYACSPRGHSTSAVFRCMRACCRQTLTSGEGRNRTRQPVQAASSSAIGQPSQPPTPTPMLRPPAAATPTTATVHRSSRAASWRAHARGAGGRRPGPRRRPGWTAGRGGGAPAGHPPTTPSRSPRPLPDPILAQAPDQESGAVLSGRSHGHARPSSWRLPAISASVGPVFLSLWSAVGHSDD
jgi:hypothetical protein